MRDAYDLHGGSAIMNKVLFPNFFVHIFLIYYVFSSREKHWTLRGKWQRLILAYKRVSFSYLSLISSFCSVITYVGHSNPFRWSDTRRALYGYTTKGTSLFSWLSFSRKISLLFSSEKRAVQCSCSAHGVEMAKRSSLLLGPFLCRYQNFPSS